MTNPRYRDLVVGALLVALGASLPLLAATFGTVVTGRPLVGLLTHTIALVLVLCGLVGLSARLPLDVSAGLFFMLVAGVGLWFGAAYPFGTPQRMGAGFVPKILCWMLGGLGAFVLLIGALNRATLEEGIPWRPLIATLASVIVFAMLIEPVAWASWLPTGLVPAAVASLLVAGIGSVETRWGELALFSLVLGVLSVLLFVKALGLSMQSGIGV